MSRAKALAAAEPTIGERGFRFCHYGAEPLLEVRAAAPSEDVREQAYLLIQTIEEVLGKAIAGGPDNSVDAAAIDTPTAYILQFAAGAAAAMVGSLEVK